MSTANDQPVLICLPTRGAITLETHLALTQNLDGFPSALLSVSRKPVDQARNQLARMALDVGSKPPCTGRETYVLWIDDDGWWPKCTLTRMVSVLRSRPEVDILAGYYTARVPFAVGTVRPYGSDHQVALSELDADKDGLCRIASGIGFHFLIHRVSVLEKTGNDPFTVPQDFAGAEDSAFCHRAREAGLATYVDFRSPIAHVDAQTGLAFLPRCGPGKIQNNNFVLAPGYDDLKSMRAAQILKRFPTGGRTYGQTVDRAIRRFEQQNARDGATIESAMSEIGARLTAAGKQVLPRP
jgi:hypothetical protein